MAIDFPSSPVTNDRYTYNNITWKWNGSAWEKVVTNVTTINGLSGGVTLAAGTGITLGISGNTLTIALTDYVQSFGGKTGIVGAGITSTQILYWSGNDVTGSNNFTFDGTDIVTLATTGHFTGRLLGPVLVPIKNTSGVVITKSTPVYVTGSVGASGVVEVAACDASNSAKMPSIGLADSTLAINGIGHAVVFGNLQSVDTSAYAYNQTVYVAPGGGLTGIKPTGANDLIQNIGRVIRVQSNSGDILVSAIGRSNDVPNIVKVVSYLQMPDGMTATGLVRSFNGLTGEVTGVTTGVSNTFTPLQIFNGGISAAGATIGNLIVTGNLTASGGITFTVSETVLIEDNIITLNSNETGTPTLNAGIEIERGTSTNVNLLWNETTDRWTFTNDGTQYYDLPTSVVTTFNGLTGAVTGVTTSVANTFTALQTFNVGITAAGATLANIRNVNNLSGRAGITFASNSTSITNSILLKDGSNDININPGSGTVSIGLGGLGALGTTTKIKLQTTDGDVTTTYGTIDSGTLTSNRTYTLPDATGTFVLDTNISSSAVTSYNGRVGAVQGVSAAVAGIGISVSGATGSVTITNTGVQSFNGLTGAVTGVTTSVANTFTALQTFNAGITASGATFTGNVAMTSTSSYTGLASFAGGITSSTTITAMNSIWMPAGNFQIGGNVLANGNGALFYNPASERFYVFGYADFNQSYNYEAGRPPLRLNVGPNHTAPILAAYVQTAEGIQLGSYSSTNMVAGIDNKGVIFSYVGLTASGATFTGNVAMTSTSSHTGLASFAGGITTSGITLNGTITASGLGTFNAGITTSGITLNGNLVASGSGKFNSGVLTDFVAPTTGTGVGGVLYLNADGTGSGGGGSITYIGDVVGDTNNTYISVDDNAVEINLYAANGQINTLGPINLNNHCTIRTVQLITDSNTANQSLFAYSSSTWCGAEFIITAQQGVASATSMKTCKILVANTSSTVNHTEYGEVVVGTDFVTFNVSISGGTVSLTTTPSGNSLTINTVVLVKATLFPVILGT